MGWRPFLELVGQRRTDWRRQVRPDLRARDLEVQEAISVRENDDGAGQEQDESGGQEKGRGMEFTVQGRRGPIVVGEMGRRNEQAAGQTSDGRAAQAFAAEDGDLPEGEEGGVFHPGAQQSRTLALRGDGNRRHADAVEGGADVVGRAACLIRARGLTRRRESCGGIAVLQVLACRLAALDESRQALHVGRRQH